MYGIGCLLLINTFFYKETSTVNSFELVNNQEKNPKVVKNQVEAESIKNDKYLTTTTETSYKDSIKVIEAPVSQNPIRDYQATTFSVYTDKGTAIISCDDYSTIFKNAATVTIPYRCVNYGNQIKDIIKNDSTAILTITGFYNTKEDNSLGKKRAVYVRKLLTSIGIDSNRIQTRGELKLIKFINNKAQGGIAMEITSDISSIYKSYSSTTKVIPDPVKKPTNYPKVFKSVIFTDGYQGQYFVGNQRFKSVLNTVNKHLNYNPSQKVYVTVSQQSNSNDKESAYIFQVNSLNVQKLMAQMGINRNRIVPVQNIVNEENNTSSNYISIIVK